MKVLFVSNLFPDASDPVRGLDNATLLPYLATHCEVRVLALRPVLPWISGRVGALQCRPADERFEPVFAPVRYIPKVGSRFNPALYAASIRAPLLALRERFAFDVLLCSWVYPDGAAVARLAPELRFPFVLIAQGSDVHAYLEHPVRRRFILETVERASSLITRSADLARRLREAGAGADKLHPIYNGVDTAIFQPAARAAARAELNLPPDTGIVLAVGNLLPVKNPLLAVRAHAELCRRRPAKSPLLLMIGAGPLADAVRQEAAALGIGERVRLLGRQPPRTVARYMQAADTLCLSSDNEGVPNVVLEAFACGLRVVATNVGGISEVLPPGATGRLVAQGSVEELAVALTEMLDQPSQSEAILAHARQFTWPQTAAAYFALLRRACEPRSR